MIGRKLHSCGHNTGTPAVDTPDDNWHVPGEAAVVLAPRPAPPPEPTEEDKGQP